MRAADGPSRGCPVRTFVEQDSPAYRAAGRVVRRPRCLAAAHFAHDALPQTAHLRVCAGRQQASADGNESCRGEDQELMTPLALSATAVVATLALTGYAFAAPRRQPAPCRTTSWIPPPMPMHSAAIAHGRGVAPSRSPSGGA